MVGCDRCGLIVFITCLLLCFCAFPSSILAQQGGGGGSGGGEVEDQSEFTYGEISHKGPQNWARLNPNWTVCGIGKLQSPIDLVDRRVVVLPTLGNIIRLYKPCQAVIKNRGHDIMLQWQGDAGGVMINRTLYKLLQCHWHSPSEHTVDGRRYQMEIHLVHKDARGNLAVIGILYRLGRADPFLASLIRTLRVNGGNTTRTVRGKKTMRTNNEIGILRNMRAFNRTGTRNASAVNPNGTTMGVVDPWRIRFGSRQYLRYMGSLTTPPCTEGVLWTVLQKVKTVSRRQMRALRTAVADGFENNARPIQHYEMPVYMYRPEFP